MSKKTGKILSMSFKMRVRKIAHDILHGRKSRSDCTAKIINFTGVTRLDLPADRVLEGAVGKLESVLVIGYDKEGNEYFASSIADGGAANWLLDRCKMKLLDIDT
jgi:hypothetical protein